jgi:hypothetical protein
VGPTGAAIACKPPAQSIGADMHDYPLLDLFLTIVYLFVWIMWIFLLIRVISDVFRSHDLSGWGKASWTLLLIVFPIIGVLIYLVARGGAMHERENRQAQANEDVLKHYVRQLSGPGSSTADELSKLAALRDSGVLTTGEFEAQKAKLLL